MTQLRIFYASDIHGSDVCFRKFLNAGRFYRVDALVLGGDITGKLLVPILEERGRFEADFQGQHFSLSSDAEVRDLERKIRDCGCYFLRGNPEQISVAAASRQSLDEAFRDAMISELRQWMELAEQRLSGSGIQCFVMPGNDDSPDVSGILDDAERVVNPDGRKVAIKDSVEMISLGYSNRTPFDSPRELTEEQLAQRIATLADDLDDPTAAIFNIHVPPYDSGLDAAPELDESLKVKSYGGQPRHIPVGSTAVRAALERYQPFLALHGHVHESRGSAMIGTTLCLNPGSAYTAGVLQGVVVSLDKGRVRSHQFVTG